MSCGDPNPSKIKECYIDFPYKKINAFENEIERKNEEIERLEKRGRELDRLIVELNMKLDQRTEAISARDAVINSLHYEILILNGEIFTLKENREND